MNKQNVEISAAITAIIINLIAIIIMIMTIMIIIVCVIIIIIIGASCIAFTVSRTFAACNRGTVAEPNRIAGRGIHCTRRRKARWSLGNRD